MQWAMRTFDRPGIRQIEVRVADGSPALHLYEKFGFRMKSHILGIER